MTMGSWTFDDEALVRRFEEELSQNIPSFPHLRTMVDDVVTDAWHPSGPLVDLGSSCGEQAALAFLCTEKWAPAILVEKAPAMARRLRERFEDRIKVGAVKVVEEDVERFLGQAIDVNGPRWSVVLSLFTLQFVRVEAREFVIRSVHERMLEGGSFVLAEKVLPSFRAGAKLRKQLHRHKERMGMTRAEILRKEARISGVLVPLPASENERMLRDAGFQVELLWAAGEFRAWLAIK